MARALQAIGAFLLFVSIAIDPDALEAAAGGGGGVRKVQCQLFTSALDVSDPLTAQLIGNFSSERPELTADYEVGLRAYEWLLPRWRARAHDDALADVTAEVEAEAAELAAQGGVGTTARTAARQQLYQAALKREVKALVDEVMPQIEINSAQEDDEVVVLLLRQLGYPTELQAEVFAAWRAAVNEFRQRLAMAERNVGALRLYAETASMAQAREELPDDLHDAAALVNATLSHFELGASANQSGVINELLQEIDLDADDLADGVRATVEAAATAHLAHRAAERARQLDEATRALKEATALDARTAELLVPPILKLLDATCGDATAGAAGDADGDDGAVEAALEAASGLSCAAVPPLRAAVRVALAADTLSILVMEVVDNGIMLAVPGAMDAGLDSPLFWGALAVALAVAFVVTVPVNRALIARGRGHAVVHRYHH